MAAVQNLEVIVEVDIGKALAALTELQDELREVAQDIETVDAVGAEGIDVRTNVDDLDTELAALAAEIEAFEATQGIDIDTDTEGFNRPFMAVGSRAFARRDRIGAGMGMLFGRGGSRQQRIFRNLTNTFRQLGRNVAEFDVRMSDIHNLLASLIPLLAVFIGALPAAITALLTLAGAALAAAAAFAVIAGLGALGAAAGGGGMPAMEDFTQFWEDIRDSFFEAFAPLAERLAPLFMDALDGLERFFQAIAGEGEALMALTDEARDFGGFLIEFVPRMLRGLAGLVEAMSGVFGELGRFLNEGIIRILRGFAKATMEALPALRDLVGVLIDALPGLVQLSIGFARVATIAIVLFQAIAFLITGFNQLGGETLGIVIAGLLTLITVTALASKVMALFSGGVIASAIVSLHNFIAAVVGATLAKLGLAAATGLAAEAVALLITTATLLIGIGLFAWVTTQTAKFTGLASSIRDTTKALKDFDRVSGQTSGAGFNPYRGGGGASGPGSSGSGDGGGGGGPSGGVTINMERTGDRTEDKSDANKAAWRHGRTSGGRP